MRLKEELPVTGKTTEGKKSRLKFPQTTSKSIPASLTLDGHKREEANRVPESRAEDFTGFI